MEGKKITAEAARDIWAAELKNGTESIHRWGSTTTHLVEVLKDLHELTGSHVDDPLGFFLLKSGDKRLPETEKVEGIHSSQKAKLRRETIAYCLVYCLLERNSTGSSHFDVLLNKALKLLMIERLEEREMDSSFFNTSNDDLGSLFGSKGV